MTWYVPWVVPAGTTIFNASVTGEPGDIEMGLARVAVKGIFASLGPVATSETVPVNPLRDATVTVVGTDVEVVDSA